MTAESSWAVVVYLQASLSAWKHSTSFTWSKSPRQKVHDNSINASPPAFTRTLTWASFR